MSKQGKGPGKGSKGKQGPRRDYDQSSSQVSGQTSGSQSQQQVIHQAAHARETSQTRQQGAWADHQSTYDYGSSPSRLPGYTGEFQPQGQSLLQGAHSNPAFPSYQYIPRQGFAAPPMNYRTSRMPVSPYVIAPVPEPRPEHMHEERPVRPSDEPVERPSGEIEKVIEGPKPWVCRFSGCPHSGGFRNKADIVNHASHSMFHVQEVPKRQAPENYRCQWSVCEKFFSDVKLRTQHEDKEHPSKRQKWDDAAGTKRYQCRYCAQLFSRADHVKRHEKSQHKDETPAAPSEVVLAGTPTEPWICRIQNDPNCSRYETRRAVAQHTTRVHPGTDSFYVGTTYAALTVLMPMVRNRMKTLIM